jgi:hypothetical protein
LIVPYEGASAWQVRKRCGNFKWTHYRKLRFSRRARHDIGPKLRCAELDSRFPLSLLRSRACARGCELCGMRGAFSTKPLAINGLRKGRDLRPSKTVPRGKVPENQTDAALGLLGPYKGICSNFKFCTYFNVSDIREIQRLFCPGFPAQGFVRPHWVSLRSRRAWPPGFG